MQNNETFKIDREHRASLKKVCIYVLSFNRGLPLEWQDLYNEFLSIAPGLVKEFKDEPNGSLRAYLCNACKLHSYNFCRHYKGVAYKPMNESIHTDLEKYGAVGESVSFDEPLDLSELTELELMVYNLHFLEGKLLKEVSEEMKLSDYRVRALLKTLKYKLIKQIKNIRGQHTLTKCLKILNS